MHVAPVDSLRRRVRMAVRNFMLLHTREQLVVELRISEEAGNLWRAACVQELIDEHDKENQACQSVT